MSPDNPHYTFNPLSNEDKELLLRNGYRPGELTPEEERDLLRELHDQLGDDEDSSRFSGDIPDAERDGTES